MKKPALLILSLSALLTLASCTAVGGDTASSSTSSETSSVIPESSEESSSEVVKTANVKAVYNSDSYAKLSVKTGDKIPTSGTITYVNSDSKGKNDYQILINKTVADMTMADDGITYTYDYSIEADSDVIIAVTEKTKSVADGYKITFDSDDHYTIFGITSGSTYKAYEVEDGDNLEYYNVSFAVIPDSGYIVDSVSLKAGESAATPLNLYKNEVTIYDYSNTLTADCSILVKTTKGSAHKIEYVDIDGEDSNVDTEKSNLPTTFTGGDQVVFSFATKEGYGITNVNFDPYTATALNNDYSYYIVSMPDEDVTVDIYTAEKMTLALTADERITNVGFYGDRDLYEAGGFDVIDPITDYTLGTGTVYVAFNVIGNYMPTGLVDFDDWGFNNCSVLGKANDGRYVIGFSCGTVTTLTVTLAIPHTVALDSSCDKVDIVFENGDDNYLEDDEVEFDVVVKDEYASSWRVKSVTAVYGSTEEEVYQNYEDLYSFYMPDENVTIKVEMYQPVKTTLSYTNNGGDYVSSIALEGKVSSSTLDGENTTSNDFEEGERVTVTIGAGENHSKKVTAYYVANNDADKTKVAIDLDLSIYDKEYEGDFDLPVGGASVYVEAVDDVEPLNLTYPSDAGITFYTSTDASSATTSLTIYPMDTFYYTVDKTVAADERLVVTTYSGTSTTGFSKVTIGDKEAIQVDVEDEDIKIVVSVSKTYSFVAKTTDGEDASNFFYFFDDNWNTYNLENGKILSGVYFRLNYPYNMNYEIDSITIGGEEGEAIPGQYGGQSYYEVTGDVNVVVSPKSSD